MSEEDTEAKQGDMETGEGQKAASNPFEIVQEIEKILADDPEDREAVEDGIEFPLPAALELIPKRYLKEVDSEDVYGETVLVTPDNLFEQLARGKVEVSLSKLAYYIPLHLIYHAALGEETMVALPLKKVVKAIGLEELKRRTPQEFRIYDISVFDDPFKEGEASAGQEENGLVFENDEPATDAPLVFDEQEAAASETGEEESKAGDAVETEAPTTSDSGEGTPEQSGGEMLTAGEQHEGADSSVPDDAAVDQQSDSRSAAVPLNEVSDVLHYRLESILSALPEELVLSGSAGDTIIELPVPDIMKQLRRGVVTVSTTKVINTLPDNIEINAETVSPDDVTRLDLKQTVASVGLDALKAATPAKTRSYDIDWMADPFEESEEKPDLEAERKSKKEKKKADSAAAPAPSPAVPEPSQLSPKATVYKPPADKESELNYYELPGNININAASADELMLLKGVGKDLAEAIVACRDKQGVFGSVFDLLKVNGLDDIRFRQMTGMKSGQKRRHRRKRLAAMLKISAAEVADLSSVANAVARKAGFDGCVISDRDGLVLAQAGLVELADNIAAVLPAMLTHISHGMNLAGLNVTGTISMSVDGKIYTVQGSENVVLAARHAESMFGESDLSLLRKVGKELAWLLSVRAYAGPKP